MLAGQEATVLVEAVRRQADDDFRREGRDQRHGTLDQGRRATLQESFGRPPILSPSPAARTRALTSSARGPAPSLKARAP